MKVMTLRYMTAFEAIFTLTQVLKAKDLTFFEARVHPIFMKPPSS